MLAAPTVVSHPTAIATHGDSTSSSSSSSSHAKPTDVQGLFLRHPYQYQHQHQIIELVEAPRPISAVVHDSAASCSSAPSSGGSYYSSSSYASSSACSDDDGDEEEYEQSMDACESVGSSYCSSDEDEDMCVDLEAPRVHAHGLSVSRILAWREGFMGNISATLSESALHHESESEAEAEAATDAPLIRKRKAASDLGARTHTLPYASTYMPSSHADSDSDSHTSKRSRRSAVSAYACPACDASFESILGLRWHARAGAPAPDACRVAVEYALE